ncbi:MAG: DNA adenine methylase [Holosporaceae bacterium]|jgi:DNA adenine methylase|nr:DNA adenine methylase [Holosporaceae bacterium]
MAFYTPLRYPGGKRKLYKFIRDLIIFNNLNGCAYVEPYAGGAGLAFSLLFNNVVNCVYLNDFSLPIYAFWEAVLNFTEDFCKLIECKPVTMEEWYKQKNIQEKPDPTNLLELGFSTFFLNRTNRSGILKGGVIGGKNQKGNWKLDARYSKDELIKRIKVIASRRDQIFINNMDAMEYLTKIAERIPAASSLIYLDPPYFEKGSALYENFYKKEDHAIVAEKIRSLPYHWIVSYDNRSEIEALYRGCNAITYSFCYTAQDKKEGSEFMAISPTLSFCNLGSKYDAIHDLRKH